MAALPETKAATMHAHIGYATMLLARSPRQHLSIAAIESWLAPAALLKQIIFYVDEHDVPLAFLTWAFLSDEQSACMEQDAIALLPLPDWNAGLHPWVIDLVAPDGVNRQMVKDLLLALRLGCERDIRWLRRDGAGRLRKIGRLSLTHPGLSTSQGTHGFD